MSKTTKRITVRMPTAAEDKAITAAAKSDPDALPLTPKQLKSMAPLRGRPKRVGWVERSEAQQVNRQHKLPTKLVNVGLRTSAQPTEAEQDLRSWHR